MAAHAPGVYRPWRSGTGSSPARGSLACRRRHSAFAAADARRPAPAHDSLRRCSSHRMRQYRQPSARALHRAALRRCSTHRPRRGTQQAHSPDPHRERAAQPHRRSRRVGRRLCRVSHDARPRLSPRQKHARPGQSIAARVGLCIPRFAPYRRCFRNGSGMDVIARPAG